MKNNIIVIGPNNSGKSTLCGYLQSLSMTEKEEETFISSRRNELGTYFSNAEYYRYFVDTRYVERFDQNMPTESTSKNIHIVRYGQYVHVDTPGLNTKSFKTEKYFTLGEHCVYVIDRNTFTNICNNLNNQNIEELEKFDYLRYLKLWIKIKGLSKINIVVSKCDDILIDSSDDSDLLDEQIGEFMTLLERYSNSNILHEDFYKLIIPIAISHKLKKGYNITESVNNYNCLLDILSDKVEYICNVKKGPGFAILDEKVRNGDSIYYRIKNVSGVFSKNEKVVLCNIKSKKTKDRILLTNATIKSLHDPSKGAVIDQTCQNLIGGIGLSIRDVSNTDVVLQRTSSIFSLNIRCRVGNMCRILIDGSNFSPAQLNQINKLDIRQQIGIVWFGEKLHGYILSKLKKQYDDIYEIIVIFEHDTLIIPSEIYKSNDKYVINIYSQEKLFKSQKNRKDNKCTIHYYIGTVQEIGYIKEISIKVPILNKYLEIMDYYDTRLKRAYVNNNRYIHYLIDEVDMPTISYVSKCKQSIDSYLYRSLAMQISQMISVKIEKVEMIAQDLVKYFN